MKLKPRFLAALTAPKPQIIGIIILLVSNLAANLAGGLTAGQTTGRWLYLTAFQSGKLFVFDLTAMQIIRTIPVEDGAGIIGLAITSDGEKIFIVDGDQAHRLRVLDAASGSQLKEYPFEHRALQLGGRPTAYLSADDRWLFLNTYSYVDAASGVRVFNVAGGKFCPVGLRARECDAPRLASSRDGTLIALCPQAVRVLIAPHSVPCDFAAGPRLLTPSGEVITSSLTSDGHHLYFVESAKNGASLQLVHWAKADGTIRKYDLRRLLQIAKGGPELEEGVWLQVSADGSKLAVVGGNKAYFLDRQSLKVERLADLPWPAGEATFALSGNDLFGLSRHVRGERSGGAALLQFSGVTGEVRKSTLNGADLPLGPTILRVAKAPR